VEALVPSALFIDSAFDTKATSPVSLEIRSVAVWKLEELEVSLVLGIWGLVL
jgi:hypothetical protein